MLVCGPYNPRLPSPLLEPSYLRVQETAGADWAEEGLGELGS